MSTHLESRHFFMADDRVQRVDGTAGFVVESMALWAVIEWEGGGREEVEQLDPAVWVTDRASRETG